MTVCAGALTIASEAQAIEPTDSPQPAPADAAPPGTDAAPPATGAPPPPPEGTDAAPPPLSPPPGAEAPGAGTPDAAPPEMAAANAEAEGEDIGRFRGGVGGLVGVFVPGTVIQVGPEGRLGYQINDMYAVYGSFGAHAGAGFSVGEDSGGVSLGAAVFLAPMFEVTLADIFFVGLGPQFLYGTFASFDAASDGQESGSTFGAFAGLLPGFKLKTGVGFGKKRPERRKQFTIALDLSVVFGTQYKVVTTTANGGSITDESGIAVGVLPMLALGYDAK
jgi:hypothetical protein